MAATFTAVPDIPNARVQIAAEGGVTGDRFYMIRRDRNGSQLIRETSEAGAVWLADMTKVRTQLAKNPSFESVSATNVTIRTNLFANPSFETNTTGVTASYGTTGAGAISRVAFDGVDNLSHARLQWTTASTATDAYAELASVGSLAAGPATVSIYVRCNRANQTFQLSLVGTAGTGATGVTNPAVVTTFGQWTRLTWTGTIVNAGTFSLRVNGTGRVFAIGDQLDIDWALAEQRAVLDDYFDGARPAVADFTNAWVGTAHASSSIQRGLIPSLATGTAASAAVSSINWALNGTKSLRIIPISLTSNDSYACPEGDVGVLRYGFTAGKTYTISATIRQDAVQTGSLHVNARKIVVYTKVGAATYVAWPSTAAPNAIGSTRVSLTVTMPAGVTDAAILLYNGAFRDGGDVYWDSLLVEEVATLQSFFDGSTGPNHAWTGTANNSTSTNSDAALPMELSDYEARQGLETDYILTDEDGVTAGSTRITIPNWGSWLKDPFRPFMNARIMWNSDSAYTRTVPSVLLKARGAKFPVVQTDRRMAPSGTIRVLTMTEEEARILMALIDTTNTVMIDVPVEFGVPVRYVSIGDITGQRTSSETDRNLTWEDRFWDLPIQEVAAPVGAPIAQSLTYDSIPVAFGSYIAIPASVETYNDLASGIWGE